MGLFKKNKIPENYPKGFGIEWTSKRSFRLGGYDFTTQETTNDFFTPNREKDDAFLLAKNTLLIQQYMSVIKEFNPDNIVELGIHRGGSVAFLHLIAKPKKLLSLELNPDRLEKLDNFIKAENAEDVIRAEFGVDQADSRRVRELQLEHMGPGRSIDLVLDDASHILGPTRSSFETLFPYIREGGSFIIEDYAAAHVGAALLVREATNGSKSATQQFQAMMSTALASDHKPCHLLAVEAMLAAMVDQGIVRRVAVNQQALRIVRGNKDIESPESFNLRELAADHWGLLDCAPDSDTAALLAD